jgi:uncharacterized protein with von Willebrand factor type A (vWA) domain
MNDETLVRQVVLFSRFLRDHGFKIFSSAITDALKGLEQVDICSKGDFYAVLRANLVTNELEWRLFKDLFEVFWQEKKLEGEEGCGEEKSEAPDGEREAGGDSFPEVNSELKTACREPWENDKETLEGRTYSPVSLLEKKDLGQFEKGDMRFAQLILKNMMSPFRVAATRRYRKSRKPGGLHFRLITRKSLKTGGIPLELFYRRKKKRLKRLVILADVSGSMDRYARFVMPFILGLKGVGPKSEVFVFSTSLSPITPFIRKYSIDRAMEIIAREVPEWSGGTRIGFSLHQFTQQYGERLLNNRTVVVILSDGWDLGGKDLLKREMQTIHQKAHAVMWLNPLSGDADYRPVCKGMQAALPFVDYFLPADSLQNLKKVGRTLSKVMIHV